MGTVLYGIFAESILKFAAFLKTHFAKDLLPSHVGVLPLGYSFPLTANDFLSKQSAAASAPREVVAFLEAMHRAGTRLAKLGVAPEHSILVSYRLGPVNQKNAARADDTLRVDNTNAAAPVAHQLAAPAAAGGSVVSTRPKGFGGVRPHHGVYVAE